MALPAPHASAAGGRPHVTLLGGFRVMAGGRELGLPVHARRVLAYLCVHSPAGSHERTRLAERLWPAVSTTRAQASLRTALWRIRQGDRRLLRVAYDSVWLGPEVEVDLHGTIDRARRLLAQDHTPEDGADVEALRGELLPGWEEEWLLLERQRIHQLQIHALDTLSRRFRAQGRHAEAIDTALAAIALEPLREASHGALIAAYVADGNVAAAVRQLASLCALLDRELSVAPSRAFLAEVHRLMRPED